VAKQLRVVDLFAGWGGFTEGVEQAGHKVVYAANHWEIAVSAHQINHPGALHVCQDLHQANFCKLPAYDVLVASPACQGHSSASQPKRRQYHDDLRATAWAVVQAAEATMPKAVIIENVPTFMRWGPMDRPDGSLYRHWKRHFELLGYTLTEIIVDATEHGVPQRRKRLFIIATLDAKKPFEYAPPYPLAEYEEPAIGEEIQWRSGPWKPIDPRTIGGGRMKVIRAGLQRHGGRFIGQDVTGHKGIPTTEAIRTVTGQDQWFAIKGGKSYRPLTVRETARAMGFPDEYAWPEGVTRRDCIVGLGNAVCPPVARDIIAQVAEVVAPGRRSRRGVAAPAKAAKRALPAKAKKKATKKKSAKKKTAKKAATKKPTQRRLEFDTMDLLELARRAREGNPVTGW
jgi:DNA (cytosine-5)-methyltransferase 1